MAVQLDGPFDYTATGILGDQRSTMLQNELHLRDQVGHVKTRGFELPRSGFAYGLSYDRRDFTAAHALRGWNGTHVIGGGPRKAKSAAERDFISLNKAAIPGGLVRAPENSDYRATHDIRRLPFDNPEKTSKMRTRRIPPTVVYGIQSRPSTPIFDLLEHKYQDKWIREKQNQVNSQRSADLKRRIHSAPAASRGHGIIYETRATLLRTYQNPVDAAPLWKLPRFTKSAKPHVQTFRTNKAKSEAFGNLEVDKIARRGDFGTGIYEPAQN